MLREKQIKEGHKHDKVLQIGPKTLKIQGFKRFLKAVRLPITLYS